MDWNKLHHDSTIVDLHTHPSLKSTLFHRNFGGRKRRKFLAALFSGAFWPLSERVTFKNMQQGGVDVLLSTAYAPESGWVEDLSLIKWLLFFARRVKREVFDPTYFDVTNFMMDNMEKQIALYNDELTPRDRKAVLVKNSTELKAALEDPTKPMAVVHAVEGGHSLQGDECGKTESDYISSDPQDLEEEILKNLQHFSDRGVAYLTLAHFYDNLVAYPVFPYPEYGLKHFKWKELLGRWDMNNGLTPIGEKVVEKMLELGMLIDIAHCTPKGREQVYDIVGNRTGRVISSHTGAFAINPDPYNLEDWEIKWLADHGGVIGTIFMNYWLSPVDTKLGLKYIERTMNHLINVGGEDVVGIGTDFDGFTDPPEEIINLGQLPRLTKYLSALKYKPETIEKILGKNSLRVLMEGWKKQPLADNNTPAFLPGSGLMPGSGVR